jgi:hypothetical protein
MTATLQPGQISAIVAYAAPSAQDNCGVAGQSCSPPLGNSFSAGTTVIICQATDNSGNTSECSFSVTVYAPAILNKCPIGKGGWKNHPSAWPTQDLTLGAVSYNQAALLKLLALAPKGDASVILASQLIAARLSIFNGSDPGPVSSTLTQADQLLGSLSGSLPFGVAASSTLGQAMVSLANTLDQYNSGKLTPKCVE